MLHVHNDDWRNTAINKAGSVIIPMAGRYTFFKDRNKSDAEKWEMIPHNLVWLLNNYMGRFTQKECVEAVGDFNYLTATYGLEKNVTQTLSGSICNHSIKPDLNVVNSFVNKPAVISLNVAMNALCFDNKSNINSPTELICEDNKKVRTAIERALTMAIKVLPKDNNHIYITPLFRNVIYKPPTDDAINPYWDTKKYVNSMLLFLSEFKLDDYNIHIFTRTQPLKVLPC